MAIFIDATNVDIDVDTFQQSEKILFIIFIVLLVVSNFIFAFGTIVRRGLQTFTQARYTIRLSLVVGGWLLGLFSFVVIAVIIFEKNTNSFDCITISSARIYDSDFFPVVYGCGLSLLAIDIIVRFKILQSRRGTVQSDLSIPTKILSVVFAFLPWMIALAVVCPLALTEIEWNHHCASKQIESHVKARVIFYGIVPSGMALVASFGCAYLIRDKLTESKNSYTFDNPMVDNNHQQNNATTATTTTTAVSLPDEKKNQYNFEMDGMNKTSPLAIPTQDGNPDSNNASFTTPISTNNTVPMYMTYDTLYDKKTLRKEAMIVVICSMIFAMTVIPYYILCVYVMDTYQYTHQFMYRVDTKIFIALDALVWIKSLFPVLVPLISMAV